MKGETMKQTTKKRRQHRRTATLSEIYSNTIIADIGRYIYLYLLLGIIYLIFNLSVRAFCLLCIRLSTLI